LLKSADLDAKLPLGGRRANDSRQVVMVPVFMKAPDNLSDGAGRSLSASTSLSLLQRIKDKDTEGWRRLVKLYGPLVLWWCQRQGLRAQDEEEVAQEDFLTVATRICDFTRGERRGSFRAWLRGITRNKLGDYIRRRRNQPQALGGSDAQLVFAQVPERAEADAQGQEEAGERGVFYRGAMEHFRDEFAPQTWEAFTRIVLDRRRAGDVAAELDMTVNAVYIAKSRILARLHEELDGLED
jgi:RNA polymerase sigma-70 factor (ECF subfamily)